MGIFFSAFSTSDLFGKLIFLLLFSVSILSWCVLLQKYFLIQDVRTRANILQQKIKTARQSLLSADETHPDAFEEGGKNPFVAVFSAIKQKTIEVLEKNHFFQQSQGKGESGTFLSHNDIELIDTYASIAITGEVKKLEKNLYILTTVISLAPFLGILGTVWGMLISLGELQHGASIGSSTMMGGLSTALATTVLGLVIAIPALIANNWLKSAIAHFYTDMEDFSHLILSQIELQYRRVDGSL